MRVNILDVTTIMLCLTFYEPPIVPHYLFIAYKYAVLLWVLIKCQKECKRNKTIISIAGAYGVITFASSFINSMQFNTVIASAMYGLQIIDVFLLCSYNMTRRSMKAFIKTIMLTFIVVLTVNDVLMLFLKYDFSNPSEEYFIGNKFVVSYLHCFVSALAFLCLNIDAKSEKYITINKHSITIKYFEKYMFALAVLLFSIFICARVTCSTGIISCLVLLFLIFFPAKIQYFLADGRVMIIALVSANILVLGSSAVLSMPFFENLIYNVLGKSVTWKGRLIIWERISKLIANQPILGYGYYNSIVEKVVGFGNPQNGVLKLLIDTGVIGLVVYALLILFSFYHLPKSDIDVLKPISAFFYAMLIASIVEINLSHMIVFMAMALFYAERCKIREEYK